MAKKYNLPSNRSLRVEEMPSVTATELKNKTADVFDLVAAKRAVAIKRHDKPRAVLLSMEEYAALTGGGDPFLLEELKAKYRWMLDDMQSPEQKAAAERLFEATPEELGEAAVRGAQRMIESGEIKL
ncbi:MAG: type II toxin-antitoxin system Phd/YefM family antitoxin [Oceanipulchritudo sp.]